MEIGTSIREGNVKNVIESMANLISSRRSSIYYWAHYDFFNNTKFGAPVPGTECDEEFSALNKESGWFRSPVNTLIYKKNSPDLIRCQYKFVTDRRIFARIILAIESINFKVKQNTRTY